MRRAGLLILSERWTATRWRDDGSAAHGGSTYESAAADPFWFRDSWEGRRPTTPSTREEISPAGHVAARRSGTLHRREHRIDRPHRRDRVDTRPQRWPRCLPGSGRRCCRVDRARRPKVSKLAANADLAGVVAAKLDDDWAPQQIAQWLQREHPGDADMRVSHESIYRDVYMPSRKAFDSSMFHRLRSERRYGDRSASGPHTGCQLRNTVSIRERPVEADSREVAGHWEGDLVYGMRPSAVATLVYRATRYSIVVALPDGHKAEAVALDLIDRMGQLPAHLRRSYMGPRPRDGPPRHDHRDVSMPVFFCDPHHPWQRCTNENTNRLLRPISAHKR